VHKIGGPAQLCNIREVQNFRGTNFQCDYQQTGFQNACFTQQRKVAPHGKEHLFPLRSRNSSDIEHFFVEGMKITPFDGAKPFLGGSHHFSRACLPWTLVHTLSYKYPPGSLVVLHNTGSRYK
jgi:hypothetical protein